jgi:DNA-binding transcriptional ArsR family regulator
VRAENSRPPDAPSSIVERAVGLRLAQARRDRRSCQSSPTRSSPFGPSGRGLISCAVRHSPIIHNQMVVDLLASGTLSDSEADRVFQALADATRRDILARAGEAEQSVSALARRYEMSLTAVQKHVAVLERSALVSKQRSGREQRVAAIRRRCARRRRCSLPSSSCGSSGRRRSPKSSPRKEQERDTHHQHQQCGGPVDVTRRGVRLGSGTPVESLAGPAPTRALVGPTPYPATFTRSEFEPGGQCRYYMTGPEDFVHLGWWRIDAPDRVRQRPRRP